MILRKILLIVDPAARLKIAKKFDYQSRSIGHYLGERIHREKLVFDCQQIVFGATNATDYAPFEFYGSQSLLVRVDFKPEEYASIEGSEKLNQYFDALIRVGTGRFGEKSSDISDAICKYLDAFRQGGYVNEWEFASKRLESGFRATVRCSLTIDEFRATLEVQNKIGRLINTTLLLVTPPDELHFVPSLGKLSIDEDKVSLISKVNKVVKSVSLASVLSGVDAQGKVT